MDYSKDIRIGTGAADLIRLIERGIPLPDSWTYMPFALTYPRADGVVVGDGYPSASWTWDRAILAQEHLDRILGFFSSATEASVAVRIRTPISSGPIVAVADFDCVMHRPLQGQDKTMVSESRDPEWASLTIRFTRLESV